VIGIDIARQIVKTWLETDYGAERHARRVTKIVESRENTGIPDPKPCACFCVTSFEPIFSMIKTIR